VNWLNKARYLTWSTGYRLLLALATYRRSLTPPYVPSDAILPPLTDIGIDPTVPPRPTSGYGWSRWWRRGQSGATGLRPANGERRQSVPGMPNEKVESPPIPIRRTMSQPSDVDPAESGKHYAKTLRLSSDQLVSIKSGW